MANTTEGASNDQPEDPFLVLSQTQLIAIEHLANGSTQSDAAKAADVARETVNRWMNQPVFEAELNRRRRETLDQTTALIRTIDQLAVQGVAERVLAGDPKAQADWLRMRGIHRIDTTDIGLEDADAIIDHEAAAHEQLLLQEDRKLLVESTLDRPAPNDYATRKYVTDRMRREAGFDPEPAEIRPDTPGVIFLATATEAVSGHPEPLEGPWSVSVTGLTSVDYAALVDVLFGNDFSAIPDVLAGDEVGAPENPTGVFALAPAITSRLAELDDKQVFIAAIDWSTPWPKRPPMELEDAIAIIGGLHNLASVMADDQHLYLWIDPNATGTAASKV